VPECPEVVDRCPDKAAQTADGCPEYKLVTVTEKKIELKQSIYFATNKATIKRVSYPLLDEVAQALADNPTIRVRIEGHTDSRGRDAFNMRLSQARTESVREYLLAKGIAAERMDTQGFGETMSIADNRTEAGRAQNRRVDFVITDR
jgi:outer membrane protein OmpA-like peptidoglycan-associated protein